jgi:hypothetical protein
MAVKPTGKPEWATLDQVDGTSGQNNAVEPSTAEKNYGYTRKARPTRQKLNWLFRKIYSWLSWAEASIDGLESDLSDEAWARNTADSTLTSSVNGLDSRLDTLEGQTLDSRLDVLEGQTLDSRLDVLEGQTLASRLDVLEGQTLDSRLDVLEGQALDNRIDALELDGNYNSLGLVPGDVTLTGATATVSIASGYYCFEKNKMTLDIVIMLDSVAGTLTQLDIALPDAVRCAARYVGYNGKQFLINNSNGIGTQALLCTGGFWSADDVLSIGRSVTALSTYVPFLLDGSSNTKFSVSIDYERLAD